MEVQQSMDDVELDFRLGARSEARCLPLRCLHTHKDFAVLKGDHIGRAFRCSEISGAMRPFESR